MMRAILLLALAGCSGAAAFSVGDGDDDPVTDQDGGASSSSGARVSSSSSGATSGSSSSGGSSTSSSSSSSSGDVVNDGGVDSGADGSVAEDASADASSPDAGQDAAIDAAVPDPPECEEQATRCVSYHQDACTAGRWATTTSEACCFAAGRYTGNGDGWFTDSVTGLPLRPALTKVSTYSAAWNICENIYLARLPRRADVLGQILPNQDVCTPGLDHHVFTEGGEAPTSTVFYYRSSPDDPSAPPKCIDVTTAQDVACSDTATPAFFCVRGF